MAWKIDLTEDTPETIDQTRPDAGWYLATVESAAEEEKMANVIIEYKITGKTFIGAKMKDTIYNPENSDTEEKRDRAAQKAKSIMGRLGLLGKDDFGKEAEIDWSKCVGKNVVIHIVDDEFTNQAGKKVQTTKLAYYGVFPLDHEKIPVAERVRLGLPLLEGQTLPKEGESDEGNGKGARKPRSPKGSPQGATPAKADADLSDLVNI